MTTTVLPNVADAIEKANGWLVTARPIIRAYLELDQIDADLICDCADDVVSDARQPVERCMSKLHDLLHDMRETAVNEQWWHASDDADEAEWDATEEFNDNLKASVATVAWAIKNVEAN